MNKALIEWISGNTNRHIGTFTNGHEFFACAYVGNTEYASSQTGAPTRDDAEEMLAQRLASEAGRVLAARDDD